MRVIGGRFRGRRLTSPPRQVRPTTDRLRESLFNSLGATVEGSVWMDLFAGSGAVSIEALSRGARHVVINERNQQARRVIQDNLRRCSVEQGFEIHELDAFTLLRRPPRTGVDFLFLDPPYRFARYQRLLRAIRTSGVLASDGIVLLEVFKKTRLDFLEGWQLLRTLKAGDSHLLILQPAGPGLAAFPTDPAECRQEDS